MNRIQYTIILISVTIAWSAEIVLMKNIPGSISPFATLAMTNGIGSLLLGAVFFKRIKAMMHRRDLLYALILAAMNVLYNALIIVALKYMDSATGSVIISFTLALIPIMMVVMGRKITSSNIIGMVIVMAGVVAAGNVSLDAAGMTGPVIMIAVCFIRAFYIIKMNDFAKKSDAAVLTVLIGFMVTVISFVIWFIIQPGTFFAIEYSQEMLASVFMEGYFICGYAVLLNISAQKYASPATCSAIYSFQIIFAVILSAIIPEMLGEAVPITAEKAVGCVLIVCGAIFSELDIMARLRKGKGDTNA